MPVDLTSKESPTGESYVGENAANSETESENGADGETIVEPSTEETWHPPVEEGSPAAPMAVEYRIQMAAVLTYKPEKYSRVEPMGDFIFESIETTEGELSRVMLGGYPNLSAARADLPSVKNRGFRRAFIIKYENGQRVGKPIR